MLRLALAGALLLAATPAMAMDLKSPDVTDGASIAAKFACTKYSGQSISPALSWTGVPPEAKSLAVTMFDPDAGKSGHWHWLVSDIPPTATGLDQGAGAAGGAALPAGSTALPNGSAHANYDGPCPPAGPAHHYQITLYALPDAKTDVTPGMKADEIGAHLAKEALAQARIVPVYAKP